MEMEDEFYGLKRNRKQPILLMVFCEFQPCFIRLKIAIIQLMAIDFTSWMSGILGQN